MNTEFGPDYFAFDAIPLRHTFCKTTLIIQQCSRIAIQKLVLSTAWPGIVGGLFGFHVRRLHNIWQCWRWSVRGYLQYTYSSISSDFHQQGSRYLRNEKEASLPQGLHHSKRGQLLRETSACKCSIGNQGIPWMQHCPVLGRIHLTWLKFYVRLQTFLGIVTLLKNLHALSILPHDAGEHLLKHRHSVGLFATQEDGRLLATNHKENIGHL